MGRVHLLEAHLNTERRRVSVQEDGKDGDRRPVAGRGKPSETITLP
jgi:hypothetical protein